MADKNFGVKGIIFISDPGTPSISIASSTIAYAETLNLNASTVAIGTDISIGGKVTSDLVTSNTYSVGIGTTVLTEKLNVNGNANISGFVSATSFVGSGASLTGVLKNQSSIIDINEYQYLLVTPQTSGTISSVSSSYNYITFNPSANYLGIGTSVPTAGLDVNGTGRFIGTVTAPTFQGTATTATNLADAANITAGTISSERLSGIYDIDITGNVETATTASGLTATVSVNTTGIITATGGFVGNLTGIASTASGLTTTASINTSGIISATKFVGSVEGTIIGIASTAIELQTTRYFSVSGDVSTGSSVAFNGTQNVGLAVTLPISGVTSATYGSSTAIPSITVNSKGIITGVTTNSITVGDGTLNLGVSGIGVSGTATFTANQATGTAVTFTVTSNATNLNTANTIVSRDGSGNFRAGIITATTFSGTATTATGLTTTASVNTSGIITAHTFSTGISTENVGFTTGIISGPNTIFINPHQIGVSTGTVRILGNLQVDGSTVTTTQANIQSSAKTVGVAISETSDIVLDGSGITIGSTAIQKTLFWNYGSSSLKTSENFNLEFGKVYQINDNPVLSSTELASSVTTASGITSVGTLEQLVVSANTSTDAVRITQLGTGSALVVEDEASPDGTAFIIASDGSIGIGTTIPAYKLTITNNALPTYNLTHAIADFTGNVDGYTQLNIRNSFSGASSSSDLIATADTGSDTTNFIDLGINNSAFSSGSWTVNGALDGYLYTSNGSLSIGIATNNTAKYLSFFVGGSLVSNEQLRINQTGVGIGTTNPTSKLHVNGSVRVSGIITAAGFVGSNLSVSGITTIGSGNTGVVINGSTGIITSISGFTTVTYVGNLTGTASTASFATTAFSLQGFTPSTGSVGSATTATNVIGGIGSITQLSVSGITTIGSGNTGVVISAGIITSISGFTTVTFVGNLTGTASTASYATTAFFLSGSTANSLNVAYATSAGVATNLAGGSSGNVPYQFNTGVTSFLSNPTGSGKVLVFNGTYPSWGDASGGSITVYDETTLVGGTSSITTLKFVGRNVVATATSSTATITLSDNLVGTALSISGISTVGILTATSIGIGTTNPLQKLHVVGNVLVAAGADTAQHINQKAYELNSGTLSWEGSAGQLFSITNNLTSGSVFSVNDVSGIPSIDVDANGTISLGAYGGNIGVGITNPAYKLHVVGSFAATAKSFIIDHPTEEGKKLQYGSLESPYHGIRLTGSSTIKTGKCVVELPKYIHNLVKNEGVNINITNIKHGKVLWVDEVDVVNDRFVVMTDENNGEYDFYWDFTAIRKDVEDIIVEF